MSQRPAKKLSDFTRYIDCEKLASKWSSINKWHYTSRGKIKKDKVKNGAMIGKDFDYNNDALYSLTKVTFDKDEAGNKLYNHYLRALTLQAPRYIRDSKYGLPKCIGVDGKLIGYTDTLNPPSCQECNKMALDAIEGYDFRVSQWRRSTFDRCRRFSLSSYY